MIIDRAAFLSSSFFLKVIHLFLNTVIKQLFFEIPIKLSMIWINKEKYNEERVCTLVMLSTISIIKRDSTKALEYARLARAEM